MEGTELLVPVSNPSMSRFRSLLKALLALCLSLCALLSLALVASQIEQHIFRRRAERLLAEIQSFELRKTSWAEAQRQLQHWGLVQKLNDHCNEHACSAEITLVEPVYSFLRSTRLFLFLDDYLRWRLRLSYDTGPFVRLASHLIHTYVILGGRPARVVATVGMRDGIVWQKGISVEVWTYRRDVFAGYVYPLLANITSVPRFSGYIYHDTQLTLHPNFEIGRPGGCEICVQGWAYFTPYADPADMHRFLQLDLSCLTRAFRRCATQEDIMPVAWAQYQAEIPRVDALRGQRMCTASIIEMLGRDTPNVVTATIVAYKEKPYGDSYWDGEARLRILENLKGTYGWKADTIQDISVIRPAGRAIRPGAQFIFVFNSLHPNARRSDSSGACSPLSLDESNLALVRRRIALDYTAADEPKQ